MKKILLIIKKYWFLPLISLAAIAYIANLLIKSSTPANPLTPSSQEASFGSITPGIATQNDVNKILGMPLKTTQQQGQTINEYKSSVNLLPHTAYFTNNTLTVFKEIVSSVDKKDSSSITNIYGVAPNVLYSKSPNSSFNLYVYPSNGLAYIGHVDGTLLETWYFQPTTIENFMSKLAPDYLLSPPTEIVQ
jgi:hypothetical protein